jgi:hypothetical protein
VSLHNGLSMLRYPSLEQHVILSIYTLIISELEWNTSSAIVSYVGTPYK